MKALTERQEKFCIEYAKSGNATEALKLAGYKYKDDNSARANASRLLTYDNIKARLQELHDDYTNESVASIQEIKEFWTAVMRNEETEEVIVTNEAGPYRITKDSSLKDRIKAAELLGRTAGIFIDNVNVTGNAAITFVDDLET